MQYLGDVQCPVSLEETSKLHTLDWLLNYAVSLEFQDQGSFQFCCSLPTFI